MVLLPKRSRTFAAFVVLLLLVGFADAGLADLDKERMHIVAKESGSFDLGNRIFRGYGDVEISYGDLLLVGDECFFNLPAGELELKGSVVLSGGGEEIRGEFLHYNLETGKGVLSSPRSEIALADKMGIIFLSGESVDIAEQKYELKNVQLTTCDFEESHYHVSARELELFVGEKAVIRGLTYYEGKLPLFYWPYLVIPLDSKEERFFSLPVLGYSEREGYFMKNSFNYYINDRHHGNLYLDLFSRLGVAAGGEHNYDLNSWGRGSLYLYRLPSQLSPVLKAAWNHQIVRDQWSLSTDTSYDDSWLGKAFNSASRLKLNLPKLNAEAWYTYKDNPQATEEKFEEYGGRWQQRLSEHWRLNLRGSWTEREKVKAKEEPENLRLLDYLAEANYRKDRHTLALAFQQQYNPDLLTDEAQSWRTVQRSPELKWEVSDLGLRGLPLRSLLQLGRYGESSSLVKRTRILGQLALGAKTWRPTDNLSLSWQGDGGASFYGESISQKWLYIQASLNQKLPGSLTLNSVYKQSWVWGESAFGFDQKKPQQELSAGLSYNKQKFWFNLSGGYDFQAEKPRLLNFQSQWRPNERWKLDLGAFYNLKDRTMPQLIPKLEYKGERGEVTLGVRYSPEKRAFERADALLSLQISDDWKINCSGIYEFSSQSFRQGRLTLTKDLHCRTLSAAYDLASGGISLQYTINAFPSLPIGWDSESGLELFDLDKLALIAGEGQ